MSNFISLHNQTVYSLLDSLCSINDLFNRAKELNQSAIAITDHGSLAGAWEAFKTSKKTGVKLIIGCECYFSDDASNLGSKLSHIIFLAKNATGYKNLLTLNKLAFDQGKVAGSKVYPIVDWKLIEKYNEGLICLTACGNGIISQKISSGNIDEAESSLLKLKNIFKDNLGIEVLANNMKRNATIYTDEIDQKFLNRKLINLGKKHNIKVVATCNTHYILPEEYDTHNVLLAIGAKQPIFSNFRLRYPVNDFYLKSEEEMISFFSRNYGEDYAKEIVFNSKIFCDMCEEPEWVDPKYSNPSGKELPIFPVKDEPDYEQFQIWLLTQDAKVQKLSEDKSYLRFVVHKSFNKKIKEGNVPNNLISEYKERINKELDVFEELDISSYMLITADFLNYARKNNIAVGPGRGCLTGNTQVLTDCGFKQLQDVEVNDKVYTHSGKLQKVFNKFEYDVDEECLEIKCDNSFGTLKLTKDHKILAVKNVQKTKGIKTYTDYKNILPPQFIKANELKVGDFIATQYPKQEFIDNNIIFDLTKFVKKGVLKDSFAEYTLNVSNKLSVKQISNKSKINYQKLLDFKYHNKNNLNKFEQSQINLITNMNVFDWKKLQTQKKIKINPVIICNNDLLYLFGRFVGDGFFSKKEQVVGFSFHKKDIEGVNKIKKILNNLGFNCCVSNKKENAIQLECVNELIFNLFRLVFPNYNRTSNTKHLPYFFRNLNDLGKKNLLQGILDSDGHKNIINGVLKNLNIKTTSKQLALEIKELLLFMKINCGIHIKNSCIGNDGVFRQTSYAITFILNKKHYGRFFNTYYLSKIRNIENYNINKVYDISVENDTSYLTSSGVVHNSAGGSYIAYLLNIHCADSIKYGLVFERFHNKLKTAMSDIDNDLLSEGRDKIIQYVRNKYGNDNVASISNVNTMTPKVYIRDVARSLELGGSREEAVKVGNNVADTVSAEIKSIDFAYEKVPLFAEYCKKYPEFIKHKNIANQFRNFSTHAAGIVVNRRPLTGLVPLRRDKVGDLVLEYEKDKTEANGLVKIDILGLKTLDIIDLTEALIKTYGKQSPIINVEDNDKETYELISSGKCDFVFQLGGSAGTMDLCKKIKPKNIEDLAIITTLARPGCKDIRSDFIKTREGKRKISYSHPRLENALKNTFGFALYDESLLVLAADTAGWDLAKADGLRKLTKLKGSKPKLAMQLHKDFVDGCINNGMEKHDSEFIWKNVVEPFGKYSFNKSHAVLYSMISYQTAYYKAHYPIEFLLANLMFEVKSNSPTSKTNIQKIKNEIKSRKVKILPPDINTSELTYKMINDKTLLTGLDALKYVGDDAIKDIISKRPFKSFQDFMARVSSKHVRANTIQALASAGALDSFCVNGIRRKDIFLYCSDYRKKLTVWKKKNNFETDVFNYPWILDDDDWTLSEKYALEMYYLNEAFVCKPYEAYGDFFQGNQIMSCHLKKSQNKQRLMPVKGVVVDFFAFKVKKETSKFYGQAMAKLTLEDKVGERFSCTVFPDRWEMMKKRLSELKIKEFDVGLALSFGGSANLYEDEMGVIINDIFDIKSIPSRPKDLSSKKVNIRTRKSKIEAVKDIINSNVNDKDFKEKVEDFLYEEGVMEVE